MIYTDLQIITQCIDEETGEIDEAKLNELQLERDEKLEKLACWQKDLRSEADAIKAEMNALKEREAAKRRKADSLARYLSSILDGKKFETAKCAITFRVSKSVVVDDVDAFYSRYGEQYCRVKTEVSADKDSIKKAIQSGVELEGAYIAEKKNISIK